MIVALPWTFLLPFLLHQKLFGHQELQCTMSFSEICFIDTSTQDQSSIHGGCFLCETFFEALTENAEAIDYVF